MLIQYLKCDDCGTEIACWDIRYEEFEKDEVCPICLRKCAEEI